MKVAVISYPGAVASSITGPYDILDQAGDLCDLYNVEHGNIYFKPSVIHFPSAESASVDENIVWPGIELAQPDYDFVWDLIIIPAMRPGLLEVTLKNSFELVNWIIWQNENGARVASICLGAFLLAETGLLNGRTATTHWMGAEQFKARYPSVSLSENRIVIDNDATYTCGGAFAFTTMMIYLIEKHCGKAAADIVSRVFLINTHIEGQTPYSLFTGQMEHGDSNICQAQDFIEKNYSSSIGLDEMAEAALLSERTFIRRFKQATGLTPYDYLQKIRTERAKRLLEEGSRGVEEICFEVGFNDSSAFRRSFSKEAGLSPGAYRKQFLSLIDITGSDK